MKILLCIGKLNSGGAEKNISILANLLIEKKYDVTILTFDKTNSKPFFFLNKKIKLVNLDLLKKTNNKFYSVYNFIHRVVLIRRFLVKGKFNCFISFINTMNITMLIASTFLNLRKIVSDRNNPFYSRNTFLVKIMKILFYNYADKLVLQTSKVKEYYWFVNKKKISVINNFFSEKLAEKIKYKLERKIKIIVVSKIEKQKGLELLISSLLQIKKKYNFKCDIYGSGSMKADIKNKIISYNISKSVFLKKPTNLSNIYKKYDLYILSSYYEGYPNSLVEAMISGLPVISSSCDYGPREIISDKKNGILFNVGSKSDLIKKIELMLSNYKFASRLGKRAKQTYISSEISRKNLKKWLKILS